MNTYKQASLGVNLNNVKDSKISSTPPTGKGCDFLDKGLAKVNAHVNSIKPAKK